MRGTIATHPLAIPRIVAKKTAIFQEMSRVFLVLPNHWPDVFFGTRSLSCALPSNISRGGLFLAIEDKKLTCGRSRSRLYCSRGTSRYAYNVQFKFRSRRSTIHATAGACRQPPECMDLDTVDSPQCPRRIEDRW